MARKRIALSVKPEYHEKLLKLAEYQNTTITTVVGELLNECESAVDMILKAYAEIEKGVDKNKVLTNMLSDGFGLVSEKLKDAYTVNPEELQFFGVCLL
jgi:hypothetical protein